MISRFRMMGGGSVVVRTLWLLVAAFWCWTTGIPTVVASSAADLNLPDFQIPLLPSTGRNDPSSEQREFHLTYVFHHGTYEHPDTHRRLAITPETVLRREEANDGTTVSEWQTEQAVRLRQKPLRIQRLLERSANGIETLIAAGQRRGKPLDLATSAWTEDEVDGPDITDKETVLSLARIASNAYFLDPNTPGWEDVGGGFNYTDDFGWEKDGLRGHVFADTNNKTVIIGLKGTTVSFFDSPSKKRDRENDNLFFGCCCGQGGSFEWFKVCDCQTEAYTCNNTCVSQAVREKSHYYRAGQDIYKNITAMYPDADIWLAGHSLGGAVSSLIGLTYGSPAVTFEAPPEAMAAYRLGLPTPSEYHLGSLADKPSRGIYHFGNNADPIFMGTCNSFTSACTQYGLSMQSYCHTGSKCIYNTTFDLNWSQWVGHHRISDFIPNVIEYYNETAKCEQVVDCQDCFNWKYFESNGTETTTTASPTSTYTRTRTESCISPRWWGCRDESTTTTNPVTTTSSSSSTSTCETPGWFGCKDPTSTSTSTITSTSASSAVQPTI
ncbi:alpha/beta-hydrolase, partial [Aulographum hederae CBS 113979]